MKKIILLIVICLQQFGFSQQLTQVSTIDALLAGHYDGVISIIKLLEYGNFGIGTFDKLDGEMIVYDGVVYQFKSDGKLYSAEAENTSPFASVVNFISIQSWSFTNINLAEIETKIDSLITNLNIPYAVKISGKYSYVKTRTVPSQEKPYKILAEVTKTQPVFEWSDQTGNLVGFRLPDYMKGINVPGYHLHFISEDKTKGGHLLECKFDRAVVEIMPVYEFKMILPENSEFGKIDFSKDRSYELKKVEKE
jgi:acetolactate decarboxylase